MDRSYSTKVGMGVKSEDLNEYGREKTIPKEGKGGNGSMQNAKKRVDGVQLKSGAS